MPEICAAKNDKGARFGPDLDERRLGTWGRAPRGRRSPKAQGTAILGAPLVIQIEHHGDRPARGVLKLIDVPGVEGAPAIARQVHFKVLKARKEALVEVLLERIELVEGRHDDRAEILSHHPKYFVATDVWPLDPAGAPANAGLAKGASLPVGLGFSSEGQGGGWIKELGCNGIAHGGQA